MCLSSRANLIFAGGVVAVMRHILYTRFMRYVRRAENLRTTIALLLSMLSMAVSNALIPSQWAQAQTADEAEAEQRAVEAQKKAEARRAAKAAAPPAALPGAEPQEDAPGHADLELDPNGALFDAINRGSLNATKEAMGRGANLHARNVLSQTPLEMAIDLNRKDIMFFLLSMRGYASDEPSDQPRDLARAERRRITSETKLQNTVTTKETKDPRWDQTGGHPKPGIGFLGFGRGH